MASIVGASVFVSLGEKIMSPVIRNALFVTCASFFVFVGCDNKPASEAQADHAKTSAVVAAQPTGVVDSLSPRYEATLAEGIDFKKPGYPSFLAEVSGMSGREEWGRWTDANQGPVKFRFAQPLPKQFTLELQARGFGPNVGQPIKVIVGGLEKSFVAESPQTQTYSVTFEGMDGADSIEIVPPHTASPKDEDPASNDQRKIGVGMILLKIIN